MIETRPLIGINGGRRFGNREYAQQSSLYDTAISAAIRANPNPASPSYARRIFVDVENTVEEAR
jgi:hypothetical protein